MTFNVDKCVVLHVGSNNERNSYRLGDQELKSSNMEKDLGIIMDSSLKFSEQCSVAVKSANQTLGLIKRTVKSRNKIVIGRLYTALVRPKLEYCIQAWRPFLRKDIDKLERVQKRATRMISECKGQLKSYEARVKMLGLITLEERITRGDLIQVFKLIKGFDNLDYRTFFYIVR